MKGTQLTVVWHVDDLKISHIKRSVVTDTILWMESKYGKINAKRGKLHDYLGMTLDFTTRKKLKIILKDYIENMFDACSFPVEATATSPTPNHLFQVNEQCDKLDKDKKAEFHTVVTKCLFLCKRARSDNHTSVASLTTRVTQPD